MLNNYVKSSIDYLYPGMVVPDDIYNADASLLLIPQGTALTATRLEQLKKFNEGAGRINVSAATQKLLLQHRDLLLSKPLTKELEDEIGYTDIKHDTQTFLDKISRNENVSQAELYSISEELSHTVEVTAPSVILELVSALASADEYLQRHSINVGMLSGLLGKWLELPKDSVNTLVLAGLLHDCGKASIPSKILNAPRPLSIVEFEVIKTHTMFSNSLLSDFPKEVQLAARWHHEKPNGRGYPDGISGDEIPTMARILAISDIYDAMVSRRSYKKPNSPFRILAEIKKLQGSDLDPLFVDVFLHNMSTELVGKKAALSDGSIGTVSSVSLEELESPYMDVAGKIVKMNEDLSCVSLYYDGGVEGLKGA